MNKYSKAIAAFLGSIVMILATQNIEIAWATPEWVDSVAVTVGTVLAVYFAPKNAE